MDNQEIIMKKSTKKSTTKGSNNSSKKSFKPVKVVYISNPMKIKTSPSNFRALVQELTGRDSDFPSDPTKFSNEIDLHQDYSTAQIIQGDDTDLQVVSSESSTNSSTGSPTNINDIINNNEKNYHNNDRFEMFDKDEDVFMPQMMEGFSGILPSTMWYESPHQVV